MPRLSGPRGCERLYPHLWKTTYLDFKVEVLKRRFIIFSPQDRIQKLLRRFFVWLGYNCKAPVTNLWAWKSVTEWNSVTMSRFHDMEDQMFWRPMTSLRTWIEPITPIKRNGSSFIRKGMLKYLIKRYVKVSGNNKFRYVEESDQWSVIIRWGFIFGSFSTWSPLFVRDPWSVHKENQPIIKHMITNQ